MAREGNLRSPTCAEALEHVTAEVARLFGDKYTVLMIDDPGAADGSDAMDSLMDEATGGMSRSPARQSGTHARQRRKEGRRGRGGEEEAAEPRVAFQIVLSEAARPPPPPAWQPLAAAVLGALSLGSSVQLGMAANVFRLPPAILDWLADPAGLRPRPTARSPRSSPSSTRDLSSPRRSRSPRRSSPCSSRTRPGTSPSPPGKSSRSACRCWSPTGSWGPLAP